jgi:hypothetical protein
MPSLTLNGIPISDEQCIGDSLEIINNAFLSLSGNLSLTDGSLAGLTSLVNTLSTTNLTVATTSGFVLQPIHKNSIILCNNASQLTVTKTGTFVNGHKTYFVQVNAGKVVFDTFNSLNGNSAIKGRYGVVTARYAGSYGWILDGDLKPAVEPPTYLTLTSNANGVEDINNSISLMGPPADTLFYYNTPNTSNIPATMDIFVNGFYRTTIDFEEDRLGTTFGYSIAGGSLTSPQVTGKFINGRLDFNIEGGNPVFKNLTATIAPGSEDPTSSGKVAITGNKQDTVYYYASPSKSMLPSYMDIYVNGFYRTTVDFQMDRVGTPFGYKLQEFVGGSQVSGTFKDSQDVYFVIPGALVPEPIEIVGSPTPGTSNDPMKLSITSVTPSYTDLLAAFPWPGQSTQPLTMDVWVDSVRRVTVDYTADRIGDKFWYRLAGVSGPSYQAEGVFPAGVTGVPTNVYLTIGGAPTLPTPTPRPTNVPTATPKPSPTPPPTPTLLPTTPTLFYLTAKPGVQGGTDDEVNAINIRSTVVNNDYNDTISYRTLDLTNMIPADPMDIYVNGTHRTTVDFPLGRVGTSFTYKLANTNFSGNSIFSPGRVDVVVPLTPAATPTPFPTGTPPPTPVLNSYAFTVRAATLDEGNYYGDAAPGSVNLTGASQSDAISITSFYINDRLFGSNPTGALLNSPGLIYVNVNGTLRSVINYDKIREGTTFGYSLNNIATAQATGTFTDGSTVSLTI